MTGPVFKRWTPEQDQYLKDNWERIQIEEIAHALGRTDDAIKQRAYKLMGTTLDRESMENSSKGKAVK